MKCTRLAPPLLCLVFMSCISPGQPERGIDRVEGAQLSHNQLRTRMLGYTAYFTRQVSETADQIAASTTDPIVQRNTRVWKIYSVSMIQSATMRVDPLMAMLDTWAATVQMRLLMERESDPPLFGDQQALAIETALALERGIEIVADEIADDTAFERGHAVVHEYAETHPIENLYFSRWGESSEVFRSFLTTSDTNAFTAVATLEDRLTHLTMSLPRLVEVSSDLARWQAELVLTDVFTREETRTAFTDLDMLGDLADNVPELVADERETAITDIVAALDKERGALVEAFDEQREAILEAVDVQRTRLQEIIQTERIAALDGVNQQREDSIDFLKEEREILVASMEEVVADAVATVPARVDEGVDRFWWRAIQVGVVGFLVGGAAVFIALRSLVDRARAGGSAA